MSVLPGGEAGDRVGDNNPSFYTQINFDYTHKFHKNFELTVSPYYQNRRFRKSVNTVSSDGELVTIRREIIDTIGVGIKARYNAPRNWFFGEVSYDYQDRKSNQVGGDYVSNVAKINIGLNF